MPITTLLPWDDPRLGYPKDDERTAAYRRAQSRWRETVLHLPYGTSSGGSPTGSMLAPDAPGGAQWLTQEIAEFARHRTEGTAQPGDASMDVMRLSRNLLSSMPLCLNVFGHLNSHSASAARVLSAVMGFTITSVGPVRVEYAPAKARIALGDVTAFDAYVPITTVGGQGFIAVETKYTETFSTTEYMKPTYADATDDRAGWFKPGSTIQARGAATNQLWRNTLLAQLTERLYSDEGVGSGSVVVLCAADDPHAKTAVAGVTSFLREPDRRMRLVTLEALVAAAKVEPDLAYWAHLFAARYLFKA